MNPINGEELYENPQIITTLDAALQSKNSTVQPQRQNTTTTTKPPSQKSSKKSKSKKGDNTKKKGNIGLDLKTCIE